jgi:hypothetical protein
MRATEMNSLELIAARKQLLLARSNEQRNQLARAYYHWEARRNTARHVTGFLKNPVVLGLLGLLAIKMPWRKSVKMGGRFWKFWKIFKMARRFL